MTCGSIMTPNPLTLRADETVAVAAERMLANRFVNLPVVDADGRYVGLFGVFDLLGLILPKVATINRLVPDLAFLGDDPAMLMDRLKARGGEPVGPLARRDLPVLRPETSEIEALLLFYRQRMSLPIVLAESGKVVGMLSYWDALAALAGPQR